MKDFCTDGEWAALRKRERRLLTVFRGLLALTPAVFIILCLTVRTGNARIMHPVLLGATALLGGAAVTVYILLLRPARQERKHLEMLRSGERRMLEGRLTMTGESFRIPKSVRVCRVILEKGGDERPVLLNVDERWAGRIPPDGTWASVAAVHSYIAGIDPENTGGRAGGERRQPSRVRRFFRQAGLLAPPLVLWLFFTVIFGSFVFYQITDTVPEKKITIYMDGVTRDEDRLAAALEEALGDPVRMVKIHPFSFMMFGEGLDRGDLYILPDSHAEQYREWLADGEGILLYDPETGKAAAGETFRYAEGETGAEPYRLYFGAASPHLEDGMARKAAELLTNPEKEEEKE